MPEAKEPSAQAEGHEDGKVAGRCNAKTRTRIGWCRRGAGQGTEHRGRGNCALHGGATPTHKTAVAKAIAAEAVVTYGLSRNVDPRDALLEEVRRTAGAVAYLESKVRELDEADLVWGVTVEDEQGATEFPGTNVKREAKPNIWRQMYVEERKLLVAVCKAAIDAGIEERRIRVAESMGLQLASVLRGVLDGLGLTPEQWQLVPGLVSLHVAAIAGSPAIAGSVA